MQALASEQFVTFEEYLAAEEISPVKHEYWNGRVYPVNGATKAMAGGSPRHADLILNVSVAIASRLRGKSCRGSSSDQRIRIEKNNTALYPDFVVKCPPEKYSEKDPNALTNPALVVEVLSPTSEKSDRSEKFEQYSLIPELRDYILVSQERILVEHFARGHENEWILRRYNSREDMLVLPHLEIAVPLDEIYEGLELPSGLLAMRTVSPIEE